MQPWHGKICEKRDDLLNLYRQNVVLNKIKHEILSKRSLS